MDTKAGKAPKKPATAFETFSRKERPKVKTEFPELDVKTTNQVLRDRWSHLNGDKKEIYEAKYRVDKENYQVALAKHQAAISGSFQENVQKPKKIAQKSDTKAQIVPNSKLKKVAAGGDDQGKAKNLPTKEKKDQDQSSKVIKAQKLPAKQKKDQDQSNKVIKPKKLPSREKKDQDQVRVINKSTIIKKTTIIKNSNTVNNSTIINNSTIVKNSPGVMKKTQKGPNDANSRKVKKVDASKSTAKMSSKREVIFKGTNSSGNNFTKYSDGSYTYSNKDGGDKTMSTYYDTGKGHAFYDNKAKGYSYHENQKQDTKSYKVQNNAKATKGDESKSAPVYNYSFC